jgi:L-threonylcarbamoyladenylate synthase
VAGEAIPDLERALAALREGQAVVAPTDTVYGIAADPHRPEAIEEIFRLKGRPETNPLPVLVASVEQARSAASDWPAEAEALARAFWPGALTIIVPKAEWVPASVVAGGETVGLRMPDHPAMLALLEGFGGPLACTSANLSGRAPARSPEHLPPEWRSSGVVVVDAGPTPGATPSTVASVDRGTLRVLRPGPIDAADLQRVVRASGEGR